MRLGVSGFVSLKESKHLLGIYACWWSVLLRDTELYEIRVVGGLQSAFNYPQFCNDLQEYYTRSEACEHFVDTNLRIVGQGFDMDHSFSRHGKDLSNNCVVKEPLETSQLQVCTPLVHRLPTEILQLIAHFLPLDSAVALSLTNHRIYDTLGAQYIYAIRGLQVEQEPKYYLHEPDRRHFLALLERDCPNHYFCQECLQLHRLDVPQRASPKALQRQPLAAISKRPCHSAIDIGAERKLFAGLDIRFEDIHLALIRNPSSKLHAAVTSHRTLTAYTSFFPTSHNPHTFLDFRIAHGSLFLRAAHWLLVPPDISPERYKLYPCPHIVYPTGFDTRIAFSAALAATLASLAAHTCSPGSSKLFRCDLCPTETQVRVEHFEKEGTALIVTCWLDLGNGRSPYEPRWRSHLWHRGVAYRDGAAVPLAEFDSGSVAEKFAAEDGGDAVGLGALDMERARFVYLRKNQKCSPGEDPWKQMADEEVETRWKKRMPSVHSVLCTLGLRKR